jgi:hypothetical protein
MLCENITGSVYSQNTSNFVPVFLVYAQFYSAHSEYMYIKFLSAYSGKTLHKLNPNMGNETFSTGVKGILLQKLEIG